MSKQILGLIPARGGSKGVPRKNIRLLAGRPLLAYTVEAALQAESLDRVVVSTDDEEIAAAARDAGAETPYLRPAKLARDESSSIAVIHHALAWFSMNEGYRPDVVALLSPTCPFRGTVEIDATLRLLYESGLDSAATIYSVESHPYFIFRREPSGRLSLLMDIPNRLLRRQDLPSFYSTCQAVLASRTSYLKLRGDDASVVNWDSMTGFEINRETAFDIDTPSDLQLAESLMLHNLDSAH